MAHGFICPRLLSLSWDTNTHNEHIYFLFDVQNGRRLHEGSHFHYKNQKHKHSEIHPKCPWSQGVLIMQMQTLRLPTPYAGKTPTNFSPGYPLPAPDVMLHVATHMAATIARDPQHVRGACNSLWVGQPRAEPTSQIQTCFAKQFKQHLLPQISQWLLFFPVKWS